MSSQSAWNKQRVNWSFVLKLKQRSGTELNWTELTHEMRFCKVLVYDRTQRFAEWVLTQQAGTEMQNWNLFYQTCSSALNIHRECQFVWEQNFISTAISTLRHTYCTILQDRGKSFWNFDSNYIIRKRVQVNRRIHNCEKIENLLCAAVGIAGDQYGFEACTVCGDTSVCSCRHSKTSIWVRSMYCVWTHFCV